MRLLRPCLSLLLAACAGGPGMVRIPSADRTPPSAILMVAWPAEGATPAKEGGPAGPLRLGIGDEPVRVTLSRSDSVVITAVGEDGDGGVKDFSLQGDVRVTCRDPATGSPRTRTSGFLRRHVPGSQLRSRAPIRQDFRFVLRTSDLDRLCPGGLISAVGQATARTANFHGGGAASPRLEFRLALSEVAVAAIPVPGKSASSQAAPNPARTVAVNRLAAGSGTGFIPVSGSGGSFGDADYESTRVCPAPGAAVPEDMAHAAAPPVICLDPPVPFMSPPSASPAGAPAPGGRGKSRTAPG